MTKLITWAKENKMIAGAIGVAVVVGVILIVKRLKNRR